MIEKARLLKELIELEIHINNYDSERKKIWQGRVDYIRTFLVEEIDQYREDLKLMKGA